MIPIRLELKNFMSYGEDVPPLEFTGMHTICLSGENGNGKSALLDAITWALWGESRAGKNKHDDLVRIGADEMNVQFTFQMDGLVYRVMRKRSKRASGNQWELQQETEDGSWRSLTGNNAGETEKAIQKLLRMSYDTFLNSAYLRQGMADQFVKQPAGKRKEILGDILDLSRYDQLEAKARERMREALNDVTDIERDLNQIDAELTLEAQHIETRNRLLAGTEELRKSREELDKELDEIRRQVGQLEGQINLVESLEAQHANLKKEIEELNKHLREYTVEIDRWNALLSNKDHISQGYQSLTEARTEIVGLESDLNKYHKGKGMIADVETKILEARHEINLQLDKSVSEEKSILDKQKDLLQTNQQLALVKKRIDEYDAAQQKRDQLLLLLETANQRFNKLRVESGRLDVQAKIWDERINALSKQEGVCSVCNSPLPPERIDETQKLYQSEKNKIAALRQELATEGKVLRSEIEKMNAQITEINLFLDGSTQDRELFGKYSQKVKDLEEQRDKLPALQTDIANLRKNLEEGSFAPELIATRTRYLNALQKLEGVDARYKDVRAKITELEPFDRQYMELSHADINLTLAKNRKERDEQQLEARRQSQNDIEKQLKEVEGVSSALKELNQRSSQVSASISRLQNEERTISQELGRCQVLIDRCIKLREERGGKEEALTAARKRHEVYDQLTKAFGKKGVQALIIENAIPEIQEEANRLLERLTDGDMSIYFETLREAKTKREGPIETLDIKVSDSLGTRPLEMYSGGEGFRAAFALRIALSKLLARRAGARLQTLIIDEGFGTQDGKGREKLVHSLYAIQDDFEKIIVITHIDELKDAFATRIEVTKTPMGSQITVMEGAAIS